jgi:hypothetical protein
MTRTGSDVKSPHEAAGHIMEAPAGSCLRTCEEFDFVAQAPVDAAFPLFGADAERIWAEDWNPLFLWPARTEDREGMVFQVAHGDRTATWINTVFDRQARRIQYVYVLPGCVATVITLGLTSQGDSTHVTVRYERTSLSPGANAQVSGMAAHDRRAGPQWSAQINRCLAGSKTVVPAGGGWPTG